jgi:hypothetical protein
MGAARIDQIFAFCPPISARCQGVGVGPGPRRRQFALATVVQPIDIDVWQPIASEGRSWRGLEAVNLFSPVDARARTVP